MANKSLNDITLDLIDFFRTAQPDADTKPGTVIRDLFIDMPASQLAPLYDEIANISNLQSLRLVSGSDLEKLAQNLGASRKVASGSSGLVLFTFSSLPTTIAINAGEIITSQNGLSFAVSNGVSVETSKANFYKSVATKYQNDLDFLSVTDQYAVEVSVKSVVPGLVGNIAKYSLVRATVPGINNVTNVFSFSGGSDQENDANFRNRVLAIFSGSNIGTALGYKNTALTNSSVLDALVVSPGDLLMTRDGTIVSTSPSGVQTITSEGTGGKVDVVILGTNVNQNVDTFIYRDKSNNNDPTNASNDVVLGQIVGDENKTITRKRIDNIAAGVLPSQPVSEILEVTGSLSGGNFTPKTTDSLGRVFGNYELVKDTGVYAGSPWAQDYFHWISNKVSLFPEDIIKAQFNGQDITAFTDVLDIPAIQQSISISNENSNVLNTDRSIVQLLHTPASTVSRVLNTNTGERYTIVNQNFDATTPYNTTGRIQISGNTLPSSSDILQVDYTWIIDYDGFSDYDGKILLNNPRSSVDSIDWGISNAVRGERVRFTLNGGGTLYTGSSSLPASSIISANTFETIVGVVSISSVINFSGRLAVVLSAIDNQMLNISSIRAANTQRELFSTAEADGLFINNRIAVGADIKYNTTIILPTDTDTLVGEEIEILYNTNDVFNVVGSNGSFIGNSLTIPAVNISGTPSQINLELIYLASSPNLLTFGVNNLPISRFGNGFSINNNIGSKNINPSNCMDTQNQTVQKNISNQYFVKLNLLSTSYALITDNIISVININTDLEYWNTNAPGTITTDTDGNYILIFSGLNSPAIGDNVLVIYNFLDNIRTQPFTFSNKNIKYNLQTLNFNFSTQQFFCLLNQFTDVGSLPFNIIDPTTGLSLGSGTDGYISSTDGYEALTFNSLAFNFSALSELVSKRLLIDSVAEINNNGSFAITGLVNGNTINISPLMSSVDGNQISVIRLSDSKDLWDPATCSVSGNTIFLPPTISAAAGDKLLVICFASKLLRRSPTRLAITLTDQLANSGVLTVSGTTITKVSNSVFVATQNGLKQNLLQSIRSSLNLPSTSSIPSNQTVVRLMSLEKVSTTTDDIVISSDVVYDVIGSQIENITFYSNEMIHNGLLSSTEFILPSSTTNTSNLPVVGDKLRATFSYATVSDSENLFFTRNGTLYTNKRFAIVNKLFVSSGFNSSQSAGFTVSFFTQPATGSRYRASYDYLAPKQNERILIRTNFNQAITDTTFAIEVSRPINADVLVRAAKEIFVDATMNIVVKDNFSTSSAIVLQNTKDRITSAINTNILGDSLNSSDLIAAAQAVDGVDRARIIYFNKDGQIGQVLTITAKPDEYFSANDILVAEEQR